MPHAVEEEEGIRGFLGEEDLSQIPDLNDINDRELDLGEKANDAEDYGDISDEDLADDETEVKPDPTQLAVDLDHDPFDDLFGDAELGSPTAPFKGDGPSLDDSQLVQDSIEPADPLEIDLDDDEDEDPQTREQRLLFEQAQLEREERRRLAEAYGELPPPPATDAELFSAIWPQFEPDKPPRFGELLPGKKAYYPGRKPLKPPKPLHLSKVTLDIQQDQEKSFKLPAPPVSNFQTRKTEAEAKGVILLTDNEPAAEGSDDDETFNLLEAEEPIGGVTWEDLVTLCQDWDIPSELSSINGDLENGYHDEPFDGSDDHYDVQNTPPSKALKRRHHNEILLPSSITAFNFNIEDPEKATARLAKKVHLDMNDPYMLVDVHQPTASPSHKRKFKRDAVGGLTKDLTSRYNISNDAAYELLKENHQSRIRGLVGHVKIEHALPAVKLQYPFYKVTLSRTEARSWHRPALALQSAGYVVFAKPAFHKKKHMRGKSAADLFPTSNDLTVADNSSILLLEYSEEYPPMMSSFGMGNRIINYYRRKDEQDTSRPKLDIGETSVLLPLDKSPFSKFGNVDSGQVVPTLSNEMYRAPIFKHRPNPRDFIISRNTTSLEGPKWCLRNVENLHVVGQEFPTVSVPGPSARKVTDAAKQRHRMFGFRMHRKGARLTNDVVVRHNPGWDIGVARTKMREFMNYDKNSMTWVPRGNDGDLEESDIRSLLKPNDVSLLYAMQVGDRQLQDAGYNDEGEDDDRDKTDSKRVRNLEEELVPWRTTLNFLQASQDGGMLAIHGEGDPTGRGEALSFIKTSMKGGFREIGESIEDRLDAKKQKELGGHKYNVAKQNKAYEAAIRRVWDAQTRSLSSTVENDDTDMEVDEDGRPAGPVDERGKTPSSRLGNSRIDDESASASAQSRVSSLGQSDKILRITRRMRDRYGKEDVKQELIRDPKVIRQYLKRRKALDIANLSFDQMTRTGDPEKDAANLKQLQDELGRLNRNKERRVVREKAKGVDSAASPDASGMSPDGIDDGTTPKKRNLTGTTVRKCANCGQVGHIKTNKKLCSVCLYMSTPIIDLPHIRLSNAPVMSGGSSKAGKKNVSFDL